MKCPACKVSLDSHAGIDFETCLKYLAYRPKKRKKPLRRIINRIKKAFRDDYVSTWAG